VEFDLYPGFVEICVQDADDIFGGLINRENAAIGPGVDAEPPFGEHVNDSRIEESVAGGANEICFVLAEGFEDKLDRAVVGDVAFAPARDQDFCTDAVGFFEKEDRYALGCQSMACDDPGSSGPDDDDRLLHFIRMIPGDLEEVVVGPGLPPIHIATPEGRCLTDLAGIVDTGNWPDGPLLEILPRDEVVVAASPGLTAPESFFECAPAFGIVNLLEIGDDGLETGGLSRLEEIWDGDGEEHPDDEDNDHHFHEGESA
jgi:hypothetical protein